MLKLLLCTLAIAGTSGDALKARLYATAGDPSLRASFALNVEPTAEQVISSFCSRLWATTGPPHLRSTFVAPAPQDDEITDVDEEAEAAVAALCPSKGVLPPPTAV